MRCKNYIFIIICPYNNIIYTVQLQLVLYIFTWYLQVVCYLNCQTIIFYSSSSGLYNFLKGFAAITKSLHLSLSCNVSLQFCTLKSSKSFFYDIHPYVRMLDHNKKVFKRQKNYKSKILSQYQILNTYRCFCLIFGRPKKAFLRKIVVNVLPIPPSQLTATNK